MECKQDFKKWRNIEAFEKERKKMSSDYEMRPGM